MTRVKICCISSVDEAQLAVRLGASALDFVAEMPSGPGVIHGTLIAEIVATVPPPIATFLLTSQIEPEAIIGQQRRCRVNTAQICDRLPNGAHRKLCKALPGVSLVQVIHVTGGESVTEAIRVAQEVDALLLDSGNQSLAVKQLGGTGRTHDWGFSTRIVESVPVPVFLAGGLRPGNVGDAIRTVRPFGVDLCTGVRTAGELDEGKLREFMGAVASAASEGAASAS